MIGQTISHYKILEKLGEGGMGVVYKAEDTKLDRTLALKFLPGNVAASEQDKARFIQEAKAAAALNHPNVCSIIDIQDHDGQMFIVMEFVDGQTLREKIGTLSQKQAIDIGIQVADGLAAAHEKGIVHRDIKPENIMVRKDGICQIMDFGLAKLRSASSKINRLTREGSTVGTAGYMSPEQIQGQDVDHRSDIFSYGVVQYEMFTGQLPFKGVHETALAYEIVNVDAAPMSVVKPDIDPALDAIVLECLEKDVNERAQGMKQVSVDLKRVRRESSRSRVSRITAARPAMNASQLHASAGQLMPEQEDSNAKRIRPVPLRRKSWMVFSLLLLGMSGLLGYLYVQALSTPKTVTRSSILAPEGTSLDNSNGGQLAISPNGKTLAFVAIDSMGKKQLWTRSLSSLSALPLPGTSGAQYPFWSPDGRAIAFFADGKLMRIDATGGPVTTICDAPSGRGGAWNMSGIILFAPTSSGPLYRVPAAGGVSSAVTKLDTLDKQTSHRFPSFLPDGKHFLFTTYDNIAAGATGKIFASALDDSACKKIISVPSNPEFAGGYLLYVLQNNLIAQPFDPGKLEVTGDPIPIVEQLVFDPNRNRSCYSVSQNGVLVYQSGSARPPQFVLVDRSGKIVSALKTGPAGYGAQLSKDGKRIVYDSYDVASKNSDIWLYDIARGINTRVTFDPKVDIVPQLSPDGNRVVFSSTRQKTADLFAKDLNGMSSEELLYGSPRNEYATSWSPDGKSFLLSVTDNSSTKWDLLLLPLTGEKKPIPLAQTEFNEWLGEFSPDGQWVSYQSDESGRYEIYARTLDPRGGKFQVSNAGGLGAQWIRKTNEIIYVSPERKVMSATVKYSSTSFEVVRTTALFDVNIKGVGELKAVTEDGETFLIALSGMEGASSPATLVMNWDEELKKK
jgi:serine/threonine protein kinase